MLDTSASLLSRLRRPEDQEAWRRFVSLYTPLLFRWARGMGLQSSDAADLVQEVFTVLVRQMPQFHYDPAQSFRGWLRAVTYNKWRDMRRQKAFTLAAVSAHWDELAQPADSDAFSEAEYHRYLVGRVLDFLQSEFQEATWKVFCQLMIEGRPVSDVAAANKLSVNAVYLIKSRVLRRLRQELAGLLE